MYLLILVVCGGCVAGVCVYVCVCVCVCVCVRVCGSVCGCGGGGGSSSRGILTFSIFCYLLLDFHVKTDPTNPLRSEISTKMMIKTNQTLTLNGNGPVEGIKEEESIRHKCINCIISDVKQLSSIRRMRNAGKWHLCNMQKTINFPG